MIVLVVIVFLLIAIILGITLFVYYRNKEKKSNSPPSGFTLSNYTVWDKKSDNCLIFDIWPPTLKPEVLDNIPSVNAPCYFSDQVAAGRTVATCVDKQIKGATGSLNLCVDNEGNYRNVGDTYIYYDNTNCQNLTPCSGSIGVLSLPYFRGDSSKAALTCIEPSNSVLTYSPCNIDNREQNFNASRFSLAFNGFYPDNNGMFYQFNYRPENTCLDNNLNLTQCQTDPQWLQMSPFSYYYHTPEGSTTGPFTGPFEEKDPIPTGFTGVTINFPGSLVSLSSLDVEVLKQQTDRNILLKYIYDNGKVLTFTTPPSLLTYKQALDSSNSLINNNVYIVNTLFVDANLFNLLQNKNS